MSSILSHERKSGDSNSAQDNSSAVLLPTQIPSEQLEVVFRNLDYTVKIPKKSERVDGVKTKRILSGLTGIIRPGRLTAVMGCSGAGKTTLLSILAGKSNVGVISGDILVNGGPISYRMLREISGFVFQDDVLLPTMTVREAIRMSALLRTPKTVSRQERNDRIEDTICTLHLERAQMTEIGSPMQKGISGGERKRTAIGIEMVVNPTMLFLDEPTTGLDSFTALSVVLSLSRLAQLGRTVVATIHQPSTEIFNLFDDLLILSRGRVAYYGPAKDVVDYFARQGYSCPKYTGPTDYLFMEVLREFGSLEGETTGNECIAREVHQSPSVISETDLHHNSLNHSTTKYNSESNNKAAGTGQVEDTQDQDSSSLPAQEYNVQKICDERIESLLSAWLASPEYERLVEECENPVKRPVSLEILRKQAPFWVQFIFLLKRSWNSLIRNQLLIFARVVQSVVLSLIVGLSFLNSNQYSVPIQIRNKSGALFIIVVNCFYVGAATLFTLALEKPVFYREYLGGFYSVPAHYLSKIALEIPFQVIWPFIFTIICYYIIGFNPAFSAYLMILTLSILVALCGSAAAFFGYASADSLQTALFVGPLVMLPLVSLSGVYVAELPSFLNWIKYISPLYYSFSGMLQVEFSRDFPNCNAEIEVCQGERAISSLNFADTFSPGVNAVFLIILATFFWFIGFLILSIKAKLLK